MEIQTVSIIGLGALGIMYGKHLTDRIGKESVKIVADKKRIERYRAEGVYANGEKCDFQYADKDQIGEPADLLIFSVKYGGLESAIESAKNQVGKHTIIISLLNGISSEKKIGEAFGTDKVLYCIAQGMDAVKQDNRLTYENMGWLSIGEAGNRESEKVKALAHLFDAAEIPYDIPDDILHHMWSKLMLNTGVNQSVAVFETNYGGVQKTGKPRDTMIAAMHEVVQVAEKEGVRLTEDEIDHWLEINAKLNPDGMPSMRQDTKAHRKTEVELFAGTIIALGKKHGIETPVNDFLYHRIKEIEAAY
ncbi:ketopantoate reductase family protein [Sporolactobacillus pectinivorans]|uniref:ketopantoate reductase family protein n=1 Tax=Sporolactobacillus pectinivorans TaxID=1591408 RepID=UPI000C2603BE|nr:ketopantoate reductase family protein [Sporolactobacillus pectinivorans]